MKRLFTREGALTLQGDDHQWARFDLAGRWRAASFDGVTYRRALSGKVILVSSHHREGERFHEVEEVTGDEVRGVDAHLREWAADGLAASGPDLPPAWSRALERAAVLDSEGLRRDAEGFHRAYRGDPITPPDQNEAVLVQSTVGCAHNACTFCVFYRDTRFSIRPAEAFARHVEEVRAFLGPTLQARRRLFLGDASALMVKPSLLHRHLELALTLLPPRLPTDTGYSATRGAHYRPTHPVSTFCDAFLTPLPAPEDLRELAHLGLDRVYLGLESGAPEVLEFIRKPASREGMLDAAERLHSAGIHLSVILMLGVGGRALADRHVADTVDLVERMSLRHGDIIQFSEFFCVPGSDYEREAALSGLAPLSRMECRAQMRTFRSRLGLPERAGGVRSQMYDSRQLLY